MTWQHFEENLDNHPKQQQQHGLVRIDTHCSLPAWASYVSPSLFYEMLVYSTTAIVN